MVRGVGRLATWLNVGAEVSVALARLPYDVLLDLLFP